MIPLMIIYIMGIGGSFLSVMIWVLTTRATLAEDPAPAPKTPIDYPLGDIDELVRWAEQRGIDQFNEERRKLAGPDLSPGNPVVRKAVKPLTYEEMRRYDILENELRCVDTDLRGFLKVSPTLATHEIVAGLRERRLKIHKELTALMAGM